MDRRSSSKKGEKQYRTKAGKHLEGGILSQSSTFPGVSPVPNTFFGSPIDTSDAKYVFFGVPFDGTSTFRLGARGGPSAIRVASQFIESYCLQEGVELDAARLPLADIGDVKIKPKTVQTMLQTVEATVARLLQTDHIPIILGGEHSLTLGAVRALPRDIVLVQFDAHMDLRDTYKGTPFSHACVQRRIVEQLGVEHLIQIGIRAISKEEYEYAKSQELTFYTSKEIQEQGATTIANRINETIPPGPPLYISVDMDVLDPAYAPAVGNPEAGGLTTIELMELLRTFAPRALLFDVTEVAPQYDMGITALSAARLITTFLCARAQPRDEELTNF